jgi:UDP-N-acetylmuramoyl-L-alanyl-D-glutamate--2,6-diaminopimelate ligase
MKVIRDILYGVNLQAIHGSTDLKCNAIVFDSRKASADAVFVAVKGAAVDGHDFIDKAIELGSNMVVCERLPQSLK